MNDVVVIGGGPAGAMAAKLLADWGRSVTIITKSQDHRVDLGESLPPSIAQTFERFGVRGDVEAADFVRGGGNTIWWGENGGPRVEPFIGGELGFQVTRLRLESVLLDCTRDAGVTVIEGTVRDIDFGPEHPVVRYDPEGGVSTRWVLDCTGRSGVLARRYRQTEVTNRTLAIVGVWRRSGWPVPDETHTLIESYADGWIWSIPTGHDLRHVTVMIDPSKTALSNLRDPAAMYRGELAKSAAINPMLREAVQIGDPVAIDATWYSSNTAAGDRFLLVGDAVSFIDPLSSYGVKKALASAYVAAVVTNTCLEADGLGKDALTLHSDIERRMFATAQQAASAFFRDGGGHAFWADRADVPVDAGGTGSEGDVESLKTDPDVLAAFATIRGSERLVLRPSPRVSQLARPVIGERMVERAAHLVHANFPEGIRYLRGVNLPALMEALRKYDRVPDLYEAYLERQPPVILPDFLGALCVMLGKGLVERFDS